MDWGFWFGSGVGAWSTELNIYEDGSFEGLYHDSDMGSTDVTYPIGTVYTCNFIGQFTQPEKVNDYTYSMKIESIELEKEPGIEEIAEGILYTYTQPYGLEDAEEILIYLPGAPISELPQDFLGWMFAYDLSSVSDGKLPFYGLYTVVSQNRFSSSSNAQDVSLDEELTAAEEAESALKDKLEADNVTQTDMNITASEIYQ